MDFAEIITLAIIAWSVLSGFLKRRNPAQEVPAPEEDEIFETSEGQERSQEQERGKGWGREGSDRGQEQGQRRSQKSPETIFDLKALLKDTLFPSEAPTRRTEAPQTIITSPSEQRGGSGVGAGGLSGGAGAGASGDGMGGGSGRGGDRMGGDRMGGDRMGGAEIRERLLRTSENQSRMGRSGKNVRLLHSYENVSRMGGEGVRGDIGGRSTRQTLAKENQRKLEAEVNAAESRPVSNASRLRERLSSESLKDAILISEILQGPRGYSRPGQRAFSRPVGRLGAGMGPSKTVRGRSTPSK